MSKFIVYEGDDEVFVTTKKKEKLFLKTYFEDSGRNVDDFHRLVTDDEAVCVSSRICVSC